jgi:phage terminase large subunit GpA-like protein
VNETVDAQDLQAPPRQHAAASVYRLLHRATAPRQRLTVSQWADAHRIISPKQGAEAGPWRTARNPLLREPMDALGHRGDVVLMFPIQLGKTEVLLNDIGYSMDRDPCPVMICLPGEVSLNKWVAQKLQPMIDETPAVRAAMSSVASREAANTRTFKDFAGGQLFVEHAGSPSRLKSSTVRKLRVDELDEFAANFGSGDDPVEMLNGRTSAYPGNYSRAYVSTPQMRSTSRIFYLWEKSDQRRYHVPCPHCGERQPLEWGGLKWSTVVHSAQPRRAWYVCRECGAEIHEYSKTEMMAAGTWVPGRPDSPTRGYTANGLYYALGLGPRWADLASMWLEAQGDQARLKTFINDRLAEPWEDKGTANVRANIVAERAEPYPLRTAPRGVVRITAGCDTQDDRLELHIIGWGRGLSFHVIDYVVIPGDPALPDVWTAVTDLLNRPVQHESGALLSVEATSFDMLGHRTEAVKHYVRSRRVRRPMASFGATANTAPILGRAKLQDVTWRGKTDRHGVHIYQLGTVDAKHVLYSRLAADHDELQAWNNKPERERDDAPARQCHFSDQLPPEYFEGLISEVFNPSKNRFEKRRGAVRNEPLDTWVHAYAAAHHPELRLHRASRADWDRWEAALRGSAPVAPPPPVAGIDVPAQVVTKPGNTAAEPPQDGKTPPTPAPATYMQQINRLRLGRR